MSDKNILQRLQKFDGARLPRFDFHLHTDWTDGKNSVLEMHQQAISIGLAAILFSEHARQSSGEWFFEFADQVRSLPQNQCKAYVGVESKILDFEGSLDCNTDILGAVDLVMAVVHRFPGEEGVIRGTTGNFSAKEALDIEFRLSMAALENPVVDILGHPFGMSIKRFGAIPSEDKMRQLIAKAAGKEIAFEINGHYHTDTKKLLEWCRQGEVMISLSSNAHDTQSLGQILNILKRELSS